MFVRRGLWRELWNRVDRLEGAVASYRAEKTPEPVGKHAVIVHCKHGNKAKRISFFNPPPVEFVLEGEVLKYVGENKEAGMNYYFGFLLGTISYLPVYQSSRCSLTCERDVNVLNV